MRRPDRDGVRPLSALVVLAGLSATLMDEVTSILFTSPATRILPVVTGRRISTSLRNREAV
jgi:hypothetical protein